MKLSPRQIPLVTVMVTIITLLVVGAVTISMLYDTGFEQQRARLVETVKSQARLLESIHQFAEQHNHDASANTTIEHTLSQIRAAHKHYQGLGKTGEFTLAHKVGNQIIFLLRHRHYDLETPKPVALNATLAEPMRRALAGKSGTLVGLDYRGQRVLAAHEPVAKLNWGIVAKLDLDEIRAPYIIAALSAGGIGLGLTLIAVIILLRLSGGVVQNLEATTANQSMILNASADSFVTIDELGIIKNFNPAAEKLFGYTATEAIGKSVNILIPYPEAKYHDHYLNEYTRTGNKHILGNLRNVLARKKDGSVFPIELTVSEIKTVQGKQFLGIIRDFSERQLVIDALREAKNAAEHASRAKSEFLARTSHELRTPLNAILGFSQLLQMKNDPLTDTQEDNINEIYIAGKHLLEVINEIIDLASAESGRIKYHLTSVPIAEISSECCTLISPQAIEKNIAIFNKLENSQLNVCADSTRLKQVLINLLTNAVKYNKDNGTITLDSKHDNENNLLISITDTGSGIHKDKLAQAFEPFERLGAEHTGTEGTGVGLSVCKELIQGMGGEIGVTSNRGQGSIFWFTLSLTSDKKSTGNETQASHAQFTNTEQIKVLYIEDDLASQHVATAIVSTVENVELIMTMTAEEGIEVATDQKPNVILMDINLPGMDGFEALAILKKNSITRNIPVVALSAAAMTQDIINGLEAGFTAYLTKPIQISEIQSLLSNFKTVSSKAAS